MRALTIPEVAEALQVSVPTVRRLITGGELPAVQVGRQWRVHPDVLDSLLRRGGASPPALPAELDDRMTALAESFPTLLDVPGVRPWSASTLCDWACSGEPVAAALAAARFVLSVWDSERDWRCGSFHAAQSAGAWDKEHRAAFGAWVAHPWTA